jgi:hypothetical protein
MLFEWWIVVIILALYKGGRLENLNHVRFRYPLVIVACFLLYVLLFWLYDRFLLENTTIVYQSVLLVLLVALYLNRSVHGVKLILVGFICNLIAIVANGGLMPVSYTGTIYAGLIGHVPELLQGDGKHVVMSAETKLWFLGDFIPIARPYGMRQVISIGDIAVSIGVGQFLYHSLTNNQE